MAKKIQIQGVESYSDSANDALWDELLSTAQGLATTSVADDCFEKAYEKVLANLDLDFRDIVCKELSGLCRRPQPPRSLLTDTVALLIFLTALRTQGIATDDGKVLLQSTLPPPIVEIPYDIADRLLRNDLTALIEVPVDPSSISDYSDDPNSEDFFQ